MYLFNTKYYFLLNIKEKHICGISHSNFHDTTEKKNKLGNSDVEL